MPSTTRRTFLKLSAVLAATLPFARLTAASAQPARVPNRGLFFDPSDLPQIRANLDQPRFAAIRAQLFDIDHAAQRKFLREELRLNNHVTDFARARTLLEHSALAFALSNDRAQLETAQLALSRILDYKRWDYFLEAGEHTIGIQRASEGSIAVCCALDWLGDNLSPDVVAEAERQLATKGAPACYLTLYGMKYPDRVRGWGFDPEENFPVAIDFRRWPLILNATNLKIIPTAALGIVAAWLHGRHPDANKWLEMSRQSARAFSVMYGADGSYDEGIGYWGYTTMHLAMLADVLHRRLGVDDRALINYTGTIRHALCMAMPTTGEIVTNPDENKTYTFVPKGAIDPAHDFVNFGDGGIAIDVSVAPWIARTTADPVSQHVALHTGVLKHYHAALWHRPDSAAPAPPGPELHDVRMSNDWIVSRTGWKPEDTVLAFRSGGPANHEHADRNSLLFKAHGERLFNDPFKAAYDPKHPRWLLRLTEAHTSVLIDGRGHQYHDGHEGTNSSWASARVLAFELVRDGMIATSDATEAYRLINDAVESVDRTVVLLKPDVLLVLDRVTLARAQPVELRFQVFNDDGRGTATANANTFNIQRPHATLAASVHSSTGPARCAAAKLDLPTDEGVFPFAQVVSDPSLRHELLTVATTAPAGGAHGQLTATHQNGTWTVQGAHRGRAVAVTLATSAPGVPVVRV